LSGADLSHVHNLTTQQLHGVTTSPGTKLPQQTRVPSPAAWGIGSSRCTELVNNMTGMLSGEGFSYPDHPWHCPLTIRATETYRDGIGPDMSPRDLIDVCRLRRQ
jgi:hypothetical protein